jgi:hypothetical protein
VSPGVGAMRRKVLADHDCYGYTTLAGVIWLNATYDSAVQMETLLHEWAHCRVGWKHEPHTQEFWKELGRITNAFHAWRDEENDA